MPNQPVQCQKSICPQCSAVSPSDSRYCDNCGAELPVESVVNLNASDVAGAPEIAPPLFRRKNLRARYFSIAAAGVIAGFSALFLLSLLVGYLGKWFDWREDFLVASRESAQLGITYERVAQNPSAYENAAVSWRILMYGNIGYYEGDWKKPVVLKDAASSRNSVVSGEPHLFRILARVKGRNNENGAIVIDEVR